jgi:hypothetical protein
MSGRAESKGRGRAARHNKEPPQQRPGEHQIPIQSAQQVVANLDENCAQSNNVTNQNALETTQSTLQIERSNNANDTTTKQPTQSTATTTTTTTSQMIENHEAAAVVQPKPTSNVVEPQLVSKSQLMYYKEIETSSVCGPKKPRGTLGLPIKLKTNHFNLNIDPFVVYQYDVEVVKKSAEPIPIDEKSQEKIIKNRDITRQVLLLF